MGAEYHSHPSGTTSKSQQSLHHPKLRSLCDSRYEAFDPIAKSLGLNSNQADKSVSKQCGIFLKCGWQSYDVNCDRHFHQFGRIY
jgi:hypothetical protein